MGCGCGCGISSARTKRKKSKATAAERIEVIAAWQPDSLKVTRLEGDIALGLCSLSLRLIPYQQAHLPSGECLGRQQLQFRALELAPAQPWVLLCLCAGLGAEELVRTNGQGCLKCEDLHREAKRLVRRFSFRCLEIRKIDRSQCTLHVAGGPPETISSVDLCRKLLEEKDLQMAGLIYIYLAFNLQLSETITLPDGTALEGRDLALKSIALDPTIADAYYCLATYLSDETTSLRLPTGEALDKRQICKKCIQLDPTHAGSYRYLGYLCKADSSESIVFQAGEILDKQKLYLKAIELEPTFAVAYNSLATTLGRGEAIQLSNGERLDKQNLYLRAIQLEPAYARAYSNLAHSLDRGQSIQLPFGETLTKQNLYLKAIELEPTYAPVYSDLGKTLHDVLTVQLPTGEKLDKLNLYLRAIELDPSAEQPYRNLSKELDHLWSSLSRSVYENFWEDTSFRIWSICGACGAPPHGFRIPSKIIFSGRAAVEKYIKDLTQQGNLWAAR